jgi:DNA-binding transcriptional LysR family regulator
MVEAGFGIALMTRSNAKEELTARTLRTIGVSGLGVGQPICLVTRKNGYLSLATKSLANLLRTEFKR